MSSIVAFVLNDARTDSRVLREAATLAAAGHRVTLVARTTDPYAEAGERENGRGFTIVRVPVASGLLRWVLLARRPRRLVAAARSLAGRRPLALAGGFLGVVALAPLLLPVALVAAAGRLVASRLPAARTAWLAVSWRLQWHFGVLPWAVAAVAAAVEQVPDASIFHAHDLRALPAAIAARDRLGRGAVVYDSHEIFAEAGAHAERPALARRALRRLERRLATRATALVTVNDELAALLGPALGIGRVVVAHNCPPRWSAPDRPPDRLRRAAGVPAGAPLVLYHGGLAPGRGIGTLAAALAEPGLETAHLVFMGSGPSRSRVERLVREPSSGGRIHLLDPVPPDELVEWVAGADIVVAPIRPTTLNHRLSTPNKVFEAIAAGVPVVASDLPAMRRIVMDQGDGPLGAVADPDDPAAFAAAIRSVLELPDAARVALRDRIRAAAAARWNWETESVGLVELFAEVGDAAVVPQRVVFVLPSSGEYDSRTRRLASDLAGRGHTVTILARAAAGLPRVESPAPGVELRRVEAGHGSVPRPVAGAAALPLRLVGEARRILGVARRAGIQAKAAIAADPGGDLYHAMGFLALPVADRLARRAGAPFVYDARDLYVESNNVARLPWPLRRLFVLRERRWARRAARVFTVNDSCADYLARSLGVPRPAVVMNGQRPWVAPVPAPDHLRARLALGAARRIVLYHGGFMPDRGLPELIAAMASPGLEAADLVLMGSGEMEAVVRDLAGRSPVGARVHLLLPVPPDHLLEWVASADVGAMPNQPRTLNERLSTPNKLFECLAAGVPVVSSDFPERRRILVEGDDGPLGAVCDPTEPASIAAALRSILDLDAGAAAALRERCRLAARSRYSWAAQLPTVLEEYGRITGRPW